MSKLERLMNLTALLLDTGHPVPASDIQSEVPGYPSGQASFRRAFERDKDDLREMGIPITVEPTPDTDPPIDGYQIHKQDYYLADPGLEPDELAAIHLAATAVRFEGGSSAEAIWKLGGVGADDPVSEELAAIPSPPHLAALFAALSERRTVRFIYHDMDREVEPRRLDFQRGHWYLSGYDRARSADRNFRLDRILSPVQVSDEGAFEPAESAAPGVHLEPWQLGDSEPTLATLLVDQDWAEQARRRLGADAEVSVTPAGDSIFEVPVINSDGFRSFVFGFLDHAEVLSPPQLRSEIVDWLTELAAP